MMPEVECLFMSKWLIIFFFVDDIVALFVTVLAQLHTWHESHTLLESSVHIVSLFATAIAIA